MKHKVLLPTDFSANAWNAIKYALELYKNKACDFYILNAFSVPTYLFDNLLVPEPGEEKYETAKQESESQIAKLLDKITLQGLKKPKHNFFAISVYNSPLEAIKNTIEEKDIEIVIMGTKGQTNSRSIVYGSNAIYVMEKSRNCPVVVVPQDVLNIAPKEIVFPTSYKTHFKRRELNCLIELAKDNKASVRFLHVAIEEKLSQKQIDNKKLLEEYFEGIDFSFHTLSNTDLSLAINCFVESRGSDMVAFINKKHAFLGSVLTQPLVKEITFFSKKPILVMHDLRN